MAEGLLKKMAQEHQITLEVQSAGLAAFAGVPPALEAVEASREKGIDISQHQSQPLSKTLVMESDVILTMTGKHKEMILRKMPALEPKVFLLSEFAGSGTEDIDDPVGQPLESYQKTLGQMEKYLQTSMERLKN
jgi:protein-tyrosine-phosphatase